MSSLAEILHNKLQEFSDLKAIRINNNEITYADLNTNGLKVASLIDRLKIRKETIGLVGQRNFTSYFAILGIIYSGCNYTPISLKSNENKILSILRDCKIKILVGSKKDIDKIEEILISNKNLHSVKYIIQDEQDKIEKGNFLLKFNFKNEKLLKAPIKSNAKDILYVLYTSGSTGKPKGVMVTNKNVLSYLNALSQIWHVKPGIKVSQFHEFNFDPHVDDLFFTWLNRGVSCVISEEELLIPYEFIKRENIEIWISVPTVFNFMLKLNLLKSNVFPSLKILRFGGEPFQKELADACRIAAPNADIENHYGPTEATINVSKYSYNGNEQMNFHNSILPIGKPHIGTTIRLIDKEQNLIKDGEIGEIVFKGNQISEGYLNDPIKTNLKFIRFSWDLSEAIWYRSGDLGFFNKDNDLEILGRIDSQIKIGGKRIEIGEIEAAFNKYQKTRGIVIVPVKNKHNIVESLTAFTINKLENSDEKYIRNDITQHIEKTFIPKRIIFIENFPLTISGKINRKELEQMAKKHLKI